MDFGQFYVEQLNNTIGDLVKQRVFLQSQTDFMTKRIQELESQTGDLSKQLQERLEKITILEKEFEKLKKKIGKLENEKQSALNNDKQTNEELGAI